MKIKHTWKHMDRSDAAEEYADKKLEKLGKYLHSVVSCEVSFELIHGSVNMNVNIHADHTSFNAHNANKDIYACIDELDEKLVRQLEKHHDKKSATHR